MHISFQGASLTHETSSRYNINRLLELEVHVDHKAKPRDKMFRYYICHQFQHYRSKLYEDIDYS